MANKNNQAEPKNTYSADAHGDDRRYASKIEERIRAEAEISECLPQRKKWTWHLEKENS
jgi:hypothetical protein